MEQQLEIFYEPEHQINELQFELFPDQLPSEISAVDSSCAEVESAVYEHPSVKEATSFGMKEERLGEEVAVAITPKDGEEIDGAELVGTIDDAPASHPLSFAQTATRSCAYHPGMSL